MREHAHYPPFGRLASIVISGPDKNDAAAMRARWRARRRAQRRRARARPRRSAARSGARPPSLAAADQRAAQFRSLGLSARLARRRAENDTARSSSRSTSIRRVFYEGCDENMHDNRDCLYCARTRRRCDAGTCGGAKRRTARASAVKNNLRAGHFLRNEGRQGEGISHALRCPGRWRDQCSPEDRICLRRDQVAPINRRATGIGRSRRSELPEFYFLLLDRFGLGRPRGASFLRSAIASARSAQTTNSSGSS